MGYYHLKIKKLVSCACEDIYQGFIEILDKLEYRQKCDAGGYQKVPYSKI